MLPDLKLTGIAGSFQLTPISVMGMLWLQTRFEASTWELICSGQVRITVESSLGLERDATAAGLEVQRIAAKTIA